MAEYICTSFTDWQVGLAHHGVKGQKWGERRYQNSDGSLTAAGREHYGVTAGHANKHLTRQFNRQIRKLSRLEKRADANAQKQIAAKYDKRAKVAGGIAVGLATAAAGSHANTVGNRQRELAGYRNEVSSSNNRMRELNDWQRNHMRTASEAASNNMHNQYMKQLNRMGTAIEGVNRLKNASSFTSSPLSTTTKALAGGAALAGGYAAYAKIRSGIAKYRSSGRGHEKQMSKYRAQAEKMVKQFSGTPFSELVKERTKKKS